MKGYNECRISSIFILLFLFLSGLALQIRSSSEEWPWRLYDSADLFVQYHGPQEYAVGSTFESNLRRVMSNLAHNTSETGFNVSSYGQTPNKVYGLLQCRANVSQQQCSQCAKNITRDAIGTRSNYGACNYFRNCQVWIGMCYVRYANYSFISELEVVAASSYMYLYIGNPGSALKYSKNPAMFEITLAQLVSKLSGVTKKGFAGGSANYSTLNSLEMIDAFVECSRDLSPANCTACLSTGVERSVSSTYLGSQVFHESCIIRYISTEAGSSTSKKLRRITWGVIGCLLLSSFIIFYS